MPAFSTPSYSKAPPEFEQRVHRALKCWDHPHPDEGLLDDLLISQQFGTGNGLVSRRQATNALLEQGLGQLRAQKSAEAELLALRFCQHRTLDEVKRELSYAESTLFTKQNRAIARLSAILYTAEMAARQVRSGRLNGRIAAAAADQPLGIDRQVETLVNVLAQPGRPFLVSIEGIGGIGKTTLAAEVLRRAGRTTVFEDFGWLSAQPATIDAGACIHTQPRPILTADALVAGLLHQLAPDTLHSRPAEPERVLALLRERLQRTPHLVVIDNVETVLDLASLLPLLHTLANPTKFVLTTRLRLCREPGVYQHWVPELDEPTAVALVRQSAHLHDLAELAEAEMADLHPIYATVGGNPLALLLVVGQLHVRTLGAVLHDLRHARSLPAATLYSYVYRQAWDALEEADRAVLRCMPQVQAHGENAANIGRLCGLPLPVVTASLQRLYERNLVFTTGSLRRRRYHIHSLTETFLLRQAKHWL